MQIAWRPDDDIEEVLIDERQLARRVAELGELITADFGARQLLLIGVLKGAVAFMVDLARQIRLPLEMDFLATSSYGASTESSGIVRILKDLDRPIEGKHVLVVEDIIDSGLTLAYVLRALRMRKPASIGVCGLLVKNRGGTGANLEETLINYVGFQVPDRFVVGYGLDYAEAYRNLPYVGVLKSSCCGDAKVSGLPQSVSLPGALL